MPHGAHPPVPECEVKAIIALKILVVLVMAHRSIDPFAQPVPAETFWIQFVSQVPVDIIDNHKEKEDIKMQWMNGYGKKKNGKYTCFYYSFQRMKSIGRPGRRVGRMMVYQVKPAE